jgi:hypothetical protein
MTPESIPLKLGLRAVYILREPNQPRPEQPPTPEPPATQRRKQAAVRSRARDEELGLEEPTP